MVLTRYIVREHILPFIFGLALIVFIFVMNLIFQMLGKVAGKGLPLMVVVEYFALNLAWILALAFPMAALVATLGAFGRLSADGEITALRALGVSPTRLILPTLFAALALTAWVGWFNNNLLPEMNHRTKLLMIDISRKKPSLSIEPGIYNFSIPNYVLLAQQVDPLAGRLSEVTIYDERGGVGKRAVITAKRGKLDFDPGLEQITLLLWEGQIHRPSDREEGGYEQTLFDSSLFRVPAPGMVLKRGESGYRGDRELSAGEMLKRVAELKSTATADNYDRRRIAAYMVEIHKKFSIPAACIVFVLLGAPLGMLARGGGIGVSGGLSLLFFTLYWALIGAGEDLADRLLISPAVAMWSPNVILAAIGIWLWWYARRHTALPGMRWVGQIVAKIIKK
ncbi:MAG: YjgP/YjgQ family permease [Calditrichaeota bacterium]|nr:YjgP/YjgQ family permease [Calditrichota bacterium]